jgi:hypothetical protein
MSNASAEAGSIPAQLGTSALGRERVRTAHEAALEQAVDEARASLWDAVRDGSVTVQFAAELLGWSPEQVEAAMSANQERP